MCVEKLKVGAVIQTVFAIVPTEKVIKKTLHILGTVLTLCYAVGSSYSDLSS